MGSRMKSASFWMKGIEVLTTFEIEMIEISCYRFKGISLNLPKISTWQVLVLLMWQNHSGYVQMKCWELIYEVIHPLRPSTSKSAIISELLAISHDHRNFLFCVVLPPNACPRRKSADFSFFEFAGFFDSF